MKGTADEYIGEVDFTPLYFEINICRKFVSGGVVLGLGSKSSRLQHWLDMMKATSQFHTRIHFLSANFID